MSGMRFGGRKTRIVGPRRAHRPGPAAIIIHQGPAAIIIHSGPGGPGGIIIWVSEAMNDSIIWISQPAKEITGAGPPCACQGQSAWDSVRFG